jgi:DNA-binding GntR family transcriptional regulator
MKDLQSVPQHRRLYEILRKHILSEVYQEGDLLPSENELCAVYGLTRPTVRQALAKLTSDGYIRKQQGKGSIVHRIPRDIGILSISGTTTALGNQNLRTEIIAKPSLIAWEEPFMFPLSELEMESGCIYFERLRLLDNIPVFYDISYIPNINLPRFTSRNFKNQSLFGILRQHYQVEIRSGEQRLKAISPSAKLRKYLQIGEAHPVLHLERKMETNRIDLNVYSSIYCNTEKYSIFGTF